MSPYKSLALPTVEDSSGCTDIGNIEGYPVGDSLTSPMQQLGIPVAIVNGKVSCGFYRPTAYVGPKGPTGDPGLQGLQGPRGPTGKGCSGDILPHTYQALLDAGCDSSGGNPCGHVYARTQFVVSGC